MKNNVIDNILITVHDVLFTKLQFFSLIDETISAQFMAL